MRSMNWHRAAQLFLISEALGASGWWLALWIWPGLRPHFMARSAPEVTLFAFGVADVVLFISTAIAAVYALEVRQTAAWGWLTVHTGAAGYAALYCWGLTILTGGDAVWGAILMTPSLVVPGLLCWKLQPKGPHHEPA